MSGPFKMKGFSAHAGMSPMKGKPTRSKPTKKEIFAAANDPGHPNSIKNMGEEAYYAWKAGGNYPTTYHGAGGKIMNEDGTVNEKLTNRQLESLKK